jgi:hypothetical protein
MAKFECKLCNKQYANERTFATHNKKYHTNGENNNATTTVNNTTSSDDTGKQEVSANMQNNSSNNDNPQEERKGYTLQEILNCEGNGTNGGEYEVRTFYKINEAKLLSRIADLEFKYELVLQLIGDLFGNVKVLRDTLFDGIDTEDAKLPEQ